MINESIEIKGFTVNRDNWHDPVDALRETVGDPNCPAVMILESVNLCPIPLMTELSLETWNLFNAIGGVGKMNSPQDYYNAQAFYIDGVNIINKAISDVQPYIKKDS